MTQTVSDTTQPTLTLELCELADASSYGVLSHSPFCLKVHTALAVLGLPYTRRHGARPDSFRDLNPQGQVPVMLFDGRAVGDSTAILAELDRVSGGRLYLREAGEIHPEERLWEELADSGLNGFLVASRWADERNWPAVRPVYFGAAPAVVRPVVSAVVRRRVVGGLVARDVWRRGPDDCWRRFASLLDDLDRRAPERGYWLGDAMGVADASLFGQLQSFRTSLTPWQRQQVESRERLTRYLDRVAQPRGALRSAA